MATKTRTLFVLRSDSVVKDSISLLVRSGYNHLRYIKPAADLSPSMYAGKVESTSIQLMMDLFGIEPDKKKATAIYRACSGFNLMWRAFDEVVDEVRVTTDQPVTGTDLLDTPVFHKYANQLVTGRLGMEIVFASLNQAIPGNDKNSQKRRDRIRELLNEYRQTVQNAANNPNYHQGPILPYGKALGTKTDVTGTLGRIGASLYATLMDLEDNTDAIETFAVASIAMQSGDDLLDWRKDYSDYLSKSNLQHVRPIENLLVATLLEHPQEHQDALLVLDNKSKRSITWIEELAPKTLADFQQRFQIQLDSLPPHRYMQTLKGIVSNTFYKLLPLAPESGWFFNWAKY